MYDVLVPVLPAIKRCRLRREKDKDQIDGWHKTSYNSTRLIFTWIDQFTEGRFYLNSEIIAFEDEKDFTIFKLWYKECDHMT